MSSTSPVDLSLLVPVKDELASLTRLATEVATAMVLREDPLRHVTDRITGPAARTEPPPLPSPRAPPSGSVPGSPRV